MPTIPLATLARAKGIRRSAVALRPIATTSAQAKELAAILMPIVSHWQAAQADILRGYVLPTNDGLTVDNANDMQGAIERAANEAARLVLIITPRLRDWLVKAERSQRNRWIGAVFTATNIDLSNVLTALPVQETVDSFLARMTALVRDVSAQTQARISDAVFRGYQQRTPIAKVAKELAEATNLGRKRAKRIASDQNIKLSAALDRERQREAGIDKFRWSHSQVAHPRAEHLARNGNVYSWDDNDLGGDYPGVAINCSCRAAAYIDLMSEID